MTFTVLFVCTGNICRSPMAERLFRARLDPAAPVRTLSAGTSCAAEPPLHRRHANIGDPYGARAELVEACARQISEAVDAVLDALGLEYIRASGSPA